MFRFSIREMMLVTALAAVFAAWLVDHRTQATASDEWKGYAGCLERLLKSDGIDILRGREWVRTARTRESVVSVGSEASVRVGSPHTEPSLINSDVPSPDEVQFMFNIPKDL
jgi:hypothetical protein